jgi:ABC-type glycerol-3-phosphate transport system permease component
MKIINWRTVRHHWEIYLFVLPTLILIGLFQYYPAASGIIHSFFRWNGADISEWVGIKNYSDLLKDNGFWRSFRVALIIGLWNIVKMIPPLLVAVCIHRCRSPRMQYLYRGLFVIPMVIPPLIVVLIWRNLFFDPTNGLLNRFLNGTGLMNVLSWADRTFDFGGAFAASQAPAWVGDPKLLLIACIIWGFPWVGSFAVLTHLAKLQGISKDVYEAADIDGVNWWSRFTRIELPLVASSIYLLLVFVIIETIKDAGTILALANIFGGPGGVVNVPALFMLRKAFVNQEMGAACAVGIILTAVVMLLQKLSVWLSNWKTLSTRTQLIARLVLLTVGATLLFLDVLAFVGVALIVFFLPWGLARSAISRMFTAESPQATARRLHKVEARAAQRYRRFGSASAMRLVRVQEYGIRAMKHLTIWAVLLFSLLPLYLMLVVSLKSNAQFYHSPMTPTAPFHWENWASSWQLIAPSLANSYFISFIATILTLLVALAAAYFFARYRMPLSTFFWNAILVLMMLPAIANLVPLFHLLRDLSLLNTLTALILVGTSAGQVFAIFVLRSFVQDIPQDLFEAAEIDGASHFRQMMLIVVPLSGPILGTVGVMRFVAEWNDFVLPLIVMRDQVRLPVMVQLLRLSGEYHVMWGPLMAGYTLASLPIIALFLVSMKLFVRGLTEGATKG